MSTEQIYEEMSSDLRRFIRRRISDEQAAEDLLQDVFVSLHNKLGTLHDEDALAAWLFRLTRNRIIDHYRKKRPELPSESPPEPDPETGATNEELREQVAGWIRVAVEMLPPKYRDAVRMAEIEGRTQAEIADALGLSLSGGKSRVQRGRKMIRQALMKCCHFELDRLGRVIDVTRNPHCCAH